MHILYLTGNTRVTIRKRIDGYPLADVVVPNVLNVLKKKQFIFEVTLDGELKLYAEDNQFTPIVVAYDPQPLQLNFVSFKNYENEKIAFYYGFDPRQQTNVIIQEENKLPTIPIWNQWNTLPSQLPSTLPAIPSWLNANTIVDRFSLNMTFIETQTVTIGTKEPKIVKWEPVVINPLFKVVLPPTITFESMYFY